MQTAKQKRFRCVHQNDDGEICGEELNAKSRPKHANRFHGGIHKFEEIVARQKRDITTFNFEIKKQQKVCLFFLFFCMLFFDFTAV